MTESDFLSVRKANEGPTTPLSGEPSGYDSKWDDRFKSVLDIYYGNDTSDWQPQVNEDNFKQSRCTPHGSEVVQIKCFTSVRASLQCMIENAVDFEIRKNWDTVLYDFRTFYKIKQYNLGFKCD
jgi:hypothetical protein